MDLGILEEGSKKTPLRMGKVCTHKNDALSRPGLQIDIDHIWHDARFGTISAIYKT